MDSGAVSKMEKNVRLGTLHEFEDFLDAHVTPQDVTYGYGCWAQNGKYDQDFKTIVHRGHLMVSDVLTEIYPPKDRGSIYILDVAAGTGRVGRELYDRGFTRIDALDACELMLEEAKRKKVYQRILCARVTDEPLDIEEGKYDAISCSAAFVKGHLPAEAIKEFVRLVKKGGIIAMVGNATYWSTISEYSEKMAAVIEDLKREGKVDELKREIKDGYIGDKYQAIIIVLKKTL